tara:strand:+ start:380 stop:634 length:255 start_codon:yes stop_codon:yes gene_type:complete
MNRKQRINKLLSNKFREFSIKIIDNSHLHVGHNNFNGENETHLQIQLKKINTNSINRLKIHRDINTLLLDEFKNGLHSLEIRIN